MSITPQQMLSALKHEQYNPVYFLYGEEYYYTDLLTNYMAANVLSATEKDFNLTIVYGKDQTMHEILAHARRFPMGGARRVVIVKEAQELSDLLSEEGGQLLGAYLSAPQPATILVWAYKHKTLAVRKSLQQVLMKHAVMVHAKKVYDHQISAWMTAYVQEKQFQITHKAMLMLQAYIGNDLQQLSNELDKIFLNLTPSATIDDALVQSYVGTSKNFNAFELQKALAKKDVTKTYQITLYFSENTSKQPVIALVALLSSFFCKLLLLHYAKDKSEVSLAKVLQVHPYFVREYMLAAQNYSLAKVLDNIQHLCQADLQLKGVDYPAISGGEILKELVGKLL